MGRGPERELQSVKKKIWYLEKTKHKRQKRGAFLFGVIASAVAPLIGEVTKPILK